MASITIAPRRRILFTLVALLYVTSFAEAKARLVPKGKKNKQLRQQKQNTKSKTAQIVLKPREQAGKQAATNLKLEATIGKNEKGESVLLLSEESVAAVSSAMQASEVKQDAQKEAQPVEMKASDEEESMDQKVLFYDPADLRTALGEVPLPSRVFDADGNEVDMAGKSAVLIPPPKPDGDHPPPKDGKKPLPKDDEVSNNSLTRLTI